MDKWRDLGTFEARNTREVQAFLIEHPQIWARYLRIEFLTHYGSEYYCPISLLRVHGTTMLEEIRPQEEVAQGENAEEEPTLEAEATATPTMAPEPVASNDKSDHKTLEAISNMDTGSAGKKIHANADMTTATQVSEVQSASASTTLSSSVANTTDVSLCLGVWRMEELTCASNLTSTNTEAAAKSNHSAGRANEQELGSVLNQCESPLSRTANQPSTSVSSNSSELLNASEPTSVGGSANKTTAGTDILVNATTADQAVNKTSGATPSYVSDSHNTAAPIIKSSASLANVPSTSSNSIRSTTSTSSIAQPQPSTQESFFKSIHKRLQQLESNSTLSLQYIEEQSRILRDAFSKVEKRQISTTTSFLSNLNETVMHELHGFRQAYDQLWQSTVIELEGQREQYQREMLALSTRLTLVADELVWQKRMGIVQSTLLLLCLGLVLFARAGNGYLEVPLMQQMMNKSQAALSRTGWESPPASPSPDSRIPVSLFRRKIWRSVTEPVGGNVTDGTDSRPDTKDGPNVNVEPPTPPDDDVDTEEEAESEMYADAENDYGMLDMRRTRSGPAVASGTTEIPEEPTPDLMDEVEYSNRT